MMQYFFTQSIINWHLGYNKRIMPWKGEKNPYKVWLSEVILQQTRVEQGLTYYTNFLSKFPTLESLAQAKEDEVFKLWEGLGYYSRCRNLIFTAKHVYENLDGKFPDNYNELLNLKGIGPYTASAISSFAYGLPHAVVDGNVYRVLSRFFGEAIPIDSNEGKEFFKKLANNVLYKSDPASYNQGIMDFGATICKPQIPECNSCVLQKECGAFNNGLIGRLPVKEKTLKRSKRIFYYFIFLLGDEVFVHKRQQKDIWQGLYEFYLHEAEKPFACTKARINKFLNETLEITGFSLEHVSEKYEQQLTHQHLQGNFVTVQLTSLPTFLQSYERVKLKELNLLAFPKFINMFLQKNRLATDNYVFSLRTNFF